MRKYLIFCSFFQEIYKWSSVKLFLVHHIVFIFACKEVSLRALTNDPKAF